MHPRGVVAEVVEQSPSQRDGHLGTVSVLDKTRRTEGQDKETRDARFFVRE